MDVSGGQVQRCDVIVVGHDVGLVEGAVDEQVELFFVASLLQVVVPFGEEGRAEVAFDVTAAVEFNLVGVEVGGCMSGRLFFVHD